MTIRKTARWQRSIDDRILEHLQDDSVSTAKQMAIRDNIHATEAQVQDRCRVLADADLVAFLTEDQDFVELTTEGEQYLKGEIDVELYPYPRHPKAME
ncbi:hypothetical protein EGO51_01080 [Haloarcula hispanica]|uniref:Winged helix-turn-helix domain-containing protein n=1 Tax=Haloarcula hispanica TaxID=51589 RepID=A0A5J5LFB6_HALHI|nr:hypothetical protein [Haloarcula hispanica]KAA9408444.1 hypothetical protein EGO51_01080 [Haloarcula hispanica]